MCYEYYIELFWLVNREEVLVWISNTSVFDGDVYDQVCVLCMLY